MTIFNYNQFFATVVFFVIITIEIVLDVTAEAQTYENRQKQSQSIKSFKYVFYYLQISTFIIVLASINYSSKYLLQLYHNFAAIYLGLGIALFGVVLSIISRKDLGKNFSCCNDAYLPHELTQSGIYRYIRHPIYTSNLLIMLGFFISSGSFFVLLNLVILFYYYQKSATLEEKALSGVFEDYDLYKKRAGRFWPLSSKL